MPSSSFHKGKSGSVERWNPSVGKWEKVGVEKKPRTARTTKAVPEVQTQVVSGSSARMYQGARGSRLTSNFGASNSSADAELQQSLTRLRSRSRQLIRDAAYARRACQVVVNNVIGSGVPMHARIYTGQVLAKTLNSAIESTWCKWMRADSCHTGGTMHFYDMERALLAQVFAGGDVLVRARPVKFGDSDVPLCLELIEAERLADEFSHPGTAVAGNQIRLGVEVDEFYRPVAYFIRKNHPGDVWFNRMSADAQFERVPADQIFHLRIVDRMPMSRGEPWLCAAIRKLNDMDGYTEAEIIAARASANLLFTKKSDPTSGNAAYKPMGQRKEDGSDEFAVEPAMGIKLLPGETMEMHNPLRPNPALDAFMRHMVREMAAASGVSYESLSRDYSQSNYSSSRLALLDDRDLWKALQQWWVRSFREPLHRLWLRQAVYSGAISQVGIGPYALSPDRYEAVCFKPRGWSWVDPSKEVQAYKEAITGGLTTRTDVIAQFGDGRDIEDIDDTRANELEYAEEGDLQYDTDPAFYMAKAAPPTQPAAAPPDEGAATDSNETDPQSRVFSFRR